MDNNYFSEINIIQEAGFTYVKWYDSDLEYHYFDAKMNGTKVEIRIQNDQLEWRFLGIPLEEIEWFSIKHSHLVAIENNKDSETKQVFKFPEKEDKLCTEPYIAYA